MGGPVHNVHVNGVHDSRVRFSDAERMDSKMKGQPRLCGMPFPHIIPRSADRRRADGRSAGLRLVEKGTSVPFASAPPS